MTLWMMMAILVPDRTINRQKERRGKTVMSTPIIYVLFREKCCNCH